MTPPIDLEAGRPVLLDTGTARGRGVVDAVTPNDLVVTLNADDARGVTSADSDVFPAEVEAGDALTLVVPVGRGVYEMPVVVTDRSDSTLRLEFASDGQLVQRRSYVRVAQPIRATCLLLDETTNRFVPFDASVSDLSGGGAAMTADVIAPKDATVVCSFALPDERPVVVIGSTLANEREDRKRLGPDGHKLRLMFTQITEADRDRLIRHLLRAAVAPRRDPSGGRP